MKKLLVLLPLFLALLFDSSALIFGSGQGDKNTLEYHISANANYTLARYVIGSGGVIYSSSSNHYHSATVGQPLIEFLHGTNFLILSGFWTQPAVPFTGIAAESPYSLPSSFRLGQNYPNPFTANRGSAHGGNSQTVIEYDLPTKCMVVVEVFNTVGQRIRTVSSQVQGPGQSQASWDGIDERGEQMGSGVYLYRVTAFATGSKNNDKMLFQQTKKMLLVK